MDEHNIISRKKPNYPVGDSLRTYLKEFHRLVEMPLEYRDLLRYENSFPLLDAKGEDTLWHSVSYSPSENKEVYQGLLEIYVKLTSTGSAKAMDHLSVGRIDYCLFGNSHPFRIKIINLVNDNHDYYYIKKADASRVYGLELEHITSPNKINYFIHNHTLVEEHIMGIPGDRFINQTLNEQKHNLVRIAKEFVKFNERSFVRLLGDMRDYNYVVDITPDFDQIQYRIRAIDFDQEAYEGNIKMYLLQFFKENAKFVSLSLKHITRESIQQYRYEERALISKRIRLSMYQYRKLMRVMSGDTISTPEKIQELAVALNKYHSTTLFTGCEKMGELVNRNISFSVKIPLNELL
tara:strand:+ start:11401 stop:12450 length:1050 start_codon:yes stop_codon:yes gene_type:complete